MLLELVAAVVVELELLCDVLVVLAFDVLATKLEAFDEGLVLLLLGDVLVVVIVLVVTDVLELELAALSLDAAVLLGVEEAPLLAAEPQPPPLPPSHRKLTPSLLKKRPSNVSSDAPVPWHALMSVPVNWPRAASQSLEQEHSAPLAKWAGSHCGIGVS